jgi:predicted TIM-barrel enzyme
MLDHTGCHGVQLGSSIERLAVEGPIEARAAAFKASRLPGRRE